ncbi:MAG: hypothetical protein JW995_15350 [Melioribacteraceae bacterium]|nr:hypothetical protein [Melioribacteraceae bacterium]
MKLSAFIQVLLFFVLFSFSFAQQKNVLIYRGYAQESNGEPSDGQYDIRVMLINPINYNDVYWSRIFLNVVVEDGYYNLNLEEGMNPASEIMKQYDKFLLKIIILDNNFTIEQYLSQKTIDQIFESKEIIAENSPEFELDEEAQIQASLIPPKFYSPFIRFDSATHGKIVIEIINYGNTPAENRLILYGIKNSVYLKSFSIESKNIWVDTLYSEDFGDEFIGWFELLSFSNSLLPGGYTLLDSDSLKTKSPVMWMKLGEKK